jgi:hypothetical protein
VLEATNAQGMSLASNPHVKRKPSSASVAFLARKINSRATLAGDSLASLNDIKQIHKDSRDSLSSIASLFTFDKSDAKVQLVMKKLQTAFELPSDEELQRLAELAAEKQRLEAQAQAQQQQQQQKLQEVVEVVEEEKKVYKSQFKNAGSVYKWKNSYHAMLFGIRLACIYQQSISEIQKLSLAPILTDGLLASQLKSHADIGDPQFSLKVKNLLVDDPGSRSPEKVDNLLTLLTYRIKSFARFSMTQREQFCRIMEYNKYPKAHCLIRIL